MDKIKKIYKKIMEAKKKGKSLISELKKLNPKELLSIKLEMLKKQAINFLLPFLGKVVLGALLLGMILALLYLLLGPLLAFLGGITKAWNYLWRGQSGLISAEKVEDVRKQLEESGTNFEEIGFIGQEMFNIFNADGNIIAKYLFPLSMIGDDQATLKNIAIYNSPQHLGKKIAEYKEKIENGNITEDEQKKYDKIKDVGIYFYLKSYIAAQEQTFNSKNIWTVDNDKGAITITADNSAKSWWDNIKNTVIGSAGVKRGDEDGKPYDFYVDFGKTKPIDVTPFVNDFAMPWQYPFIFHENTLSPDIGFYVAKLGGTQHKLNLHIYNVSTKIQEVYYTPIMESDEDGYPIYDDEGNTVYKKDADGNLIYEEYYKIEYPATDASDEEIKEKFGDEKSSFIAVPTYIQTWYATREYTYKIVETKEEDRQKIKEEIMDDYNDYSDDNVKVIYYSLPNTLEQTSSNVKINEAGKKAMDDILLPYPEYNTETNADGKQIIKLTNADKVKAYFTANVTTGDAYEITNKYSDKGKTIIDIRTNADIIIKSIKDLYSDEISKPSPVMVEEGFSAKAGSGSGIEYRTSLTSDEYNKQLESVESDGRDEYDLTNSPQVVRDLAEYFANAGVIDATMYNMGAYSNFLLDSNYLVWPLNEGADDLSSYTVDVQTLIAKINSKPNTDVLAPFGGVVTRLDNNTVRITKRVINEEGNEQDGMSVIIGNIKVTIIDGATVSAKDVIGKTNNESDNSYITYEQIDVTGATQNPTENLEYARLVITADWVWPVPAGTNISSYFGYRSFDGKNHTGIDIAEARNTSVVAIAAGTVTIKKSGLSPDTGRCPGGAGYGNYLYVDHGGGITSYYCHLNGIAVSNGQTVSKGQRIGILGHTGNSSGPHLHFEIRENGKAVNPLLPKYLGKFATHRNNN